MYVLFLLFSAHNIGEGSVIVMTCSPNILGEFYLLPSSRRKEIVAGYIFGSIFKCKQVGDIRGFDKVLMGPLSGCQDFQIK